MANYEGFGENSPGQSRRPGIENMSERVQLISYAIYDELEVFVDSFGQDAGHGFIVMIAKKVVGSEFRLKPWQPKVLLRLSLIY